MLRNWTVHNLIGHPLMALAQLAGFDRLGQAVHDHTIPRDWTMDELDGHLDRRHSD